MRKNALIVTILLIISMFCGCSTASDAKLFTEKADRAFENREYQEALDYYLQARETDNATNKVNALCEIISAYLDSNEAYNRGDYDKAFEIINNLEYDYNPYSPINDDIRKLISELKGKTTDEDRIEDALDDLAEYIGESDFERAYEVINELEGYTLNSNQSDEFEYQLKRMQRKQDTDEKEPDGDKNENQDKADEDDSSETETSDIDEEQEIEDVPDGWYRVRKSWEDSETQLSAFKSLENAKKEVDQNPGYKVFDANGNIVYE